MQLRTEELYSFLFLLSHNDFFDGLLLEFLFQVLKQEQYGDVDNDKDSYINQVTTHHRTRNGFRGLYFPEKQLQRPTNDEGCRR